MGSPKGNNAPRRSKEVNKKLGSWREAADKLEAPAIAGQPIPLSLVTGQIKSIYDRWLKWLTDQGVMSANFGEALSLYAIAMADYINHRERLDSLTELSRKHRDQRRALFDKLSKLPPGKEHRKNPEYVELQRQMDALMYEIEDVGKEMRQVNSAWRESEAIILRLGPELGWSPLTRRRVPVATGPKAGEGGALDKFRRPARSVGNEAVSVPFAVPEAIG
jgi:hypothetical protein